MEIIVVLESKRYWARQSHGTTNYKATSFIYILLQNLKSTHKEKDFEQFDRRETLKVQGSGMLYNQCVIHNFMSIFK